MLSNLYLNFNYTLFYHCYNLLLTKHSTLFFNPINLMSVVAKPIKSASLILARAHKSLTSHFNYQLLMLQKNAKSTWGLNLVFPGGLYDPFHDNILKELFDLPT